MHTFPFFQSCVRIKDVIFVKFFESVMDPEKEDMCQRLLVATWAQMNTMEGMPKAWGQCSRLHLPQPGLTEPACHKCTSQCRLPLIRGPDT